MGKIIPRFILKWEDSYLEKEFRYLFDLFMEVKRNIRNHNHYYVEDVTWNGMSLMFGVNVSVIASSFRYAYIWNYKKGCSELETEEQHKERLKLTILTVYAMMQLNKIPLCLWKRPEGCPSKQRGRNFRKIKMCIQLAMEPFEELKNIGVVEINYAKLRQLLKKSFEKIQEMYKKSLNQSI